MSPTNFLASCSLTLLLAAPAAHAQSCFRYEGQTIQDAAADAISYGILDESVSNLPCLKQLIAQGADLSQSGTWGSDRTAISEAAHSGNPEMMAYVLSLNLPITELQDKTQAMYLADIAAVGGSTEIVKMLQARGLPMSYENGGWPQPYMKASNYFLPTCSAIMGEAIEYLRADLVTYLLGQGANPNARCAEGSPLYDNDGFPTPLHRLANSIEATDNLNGDVAGRRVHANALVKILVGAGADLNAKEDNRGVTAANALLGSSWISPEMKAFVRARVKK